MDLSFLKNIQNLPSTTPFNLDEEEVEELDENTIYGYFVKHKDEFGSWADQILKNPLPLKEASKKIEPNTFYPLLPNVFNAFKKTKLEDVKVVIWGQDPYPSLDEYGDCVAMGISFGVKNTTPIPKSLNNIFKELHYEWSNLFDEKNDINMNGSIKESLFEIPNNGCLDRWCEQGVLMLNKSLTFCNLEGEKTKYINVWIPFINQIVNIINENVMDCIHVLWGNNAKELSNIIVSRNVITGAHPSPLSAYRFWGKKYFVQVNKMLEDSKKLQIDWNLTEGKKPTTLKNLKILKKKYN